jgi:hypothetical protein
MASIEVLIPYSDFKINEVYSAASNHQFIYLSTNKGLLAIDKHQKNKQSTVIKASPAFELLQNNQNIWAYHLDGDLYELKNTSLEKVNNSEQLKPLIAGRLIHHIAKNREKLILNTVIGKKWFQYAENEWKVFEPENRQNAKLILEYGNSFITGFYTSAEKQQSLGFQKGNKIFEIKLTQNSINASKSHLITLSNNEFLYALGQEMIQFNESEIVSRSYLENPISYLFEDKIGRIWVAMEDGGVNLFDNASSNATIITHFLSNNDVLHLTEDKNGNILAIASKKGITLIPSGNSIEYAQPNLFSNTKNTAKNDKDSTSIVLSINSIEHDSISLSPFKIVLSQILMFDALLPVNDTIQLLHNQNHLKFVFGNLTQNKSEKLQFRYVLEGLEKNWTYTDNNYAQFHFLPPGNYTLKAQSINKEGNLSENMLTLFIKIDKPLWQKTWFLTTLSLILIFFIITSFYLYTIWIKRKAAKKSEADKRLAELEMNALRSQMNPHFIFNTLSSIQNFILNKDEKEANKYLSKFAKLMRSIVQNSDKSFINLQEEIHTLELYLHLEQLRFPNKFDYRFEISEKVSLSDDIIPPMILQPFIENSIRHGIAHLKDRKGLILIQIDRYDYFLKCIVFDNGIGRKQSSLINQQKHSTHQSKGMHITKERLQLLNQLYKEIVSLEIIDLYEAHQAVGTEIHILIPQKI